MSALQSMSNQSVALILGAGFSAAAGLPVTAALFQTDEIPRHFSKKARESHRQVLEAWHRWKTGVPRGNAEEWLRVLYSTDDSQMYGTTFEKAIRFALARLVDVPGGKNSAYYYGITTAITTKNHQTIQGDVHVQFWKTIRETFETKAIVSMNYDILVEQGLKATTEDRRSTPLCYYGGFHRPQEVRTYLDITAKAPEDAYILRDLDGQIPLFKMHGSLNWSMEASNFEIRDHVAAIFRADSQRGDLAIVPPLREKGPSWLANVWTYAEKSLAKQPVWLVCGYSLPPYDEALQGFFSRAAAQNDNLRIGILDPCADQLKDRWKAVAPHAKTIISTLGIPNALSNEPWERFLSLLLA